MPTPTPPVFSTEQDQNQQNTLGTEPGKLKPENDPNYEGYKKGVRHDPGHEGEPAWEFRNGQWVHVATGKGAADERKPGGGATVTNWFGGLLSGDTDVMGNDTAQGAAKKAAAAAAAKGQSDQDAISARMQAFIDEMLGPMNTNDPVYQGLLQAGTDAAQRHAGQAGLGGRSSLAGTQSASVAQQNVQPWMAARQGAGAAMLSQLSNRDISLANLSQGQQQINQGLAESQYNAQQNSNRTFGSIAGGIVGMTPIGAAIGGPMGGAALGGSLASLGGGGGPAYSPQPYKPGGGYKPSGSGY